MEHFSEWKIKDRFPSKDLQSIEPISIRAFSLLSRNKNRLDTIPGAVELLGGLNIMEALDYHYENFLRLKDLENNTNHIHEVVAYLNRVGQIYYFIKSDFTKKFISKPLKLTPKVDQLKVFRMKNTAHRSIDYPKDETKEYKNRQAITFIGFQINNHMGYKSFNLPTENNGLTEWNYFTPELDHQIVMSELYNLIKKILENIA